MKVVKAHAFGNDFLLISESDLPAGVDRESLTVRLCERHRGIGADGVIFFDERADDRGGGVRMHLLNADGSFSEVSGNGVRCLAAWVAISRDARPGKIVNIDTDAGRKASELLAQDGRRLTFRAAMGQPEQLQRRAIDVDGTPIDAITLRVGNPQCVVLGEVERGAPARSGRSTRRASRSSPRDRTSSWHRSRRRAGCGS